MSCKQTLVYDHAHIQPDGHMDSPKTSCSGTVLMVAQALKIKQHINWHVHKK